jgi:hypothetical protein
MSNGTLRRLGLLGVCAITAILCLCHAHEAKGDQPPTIWPVVVALHRSFDFSDASSAAVSLEIFGGDGDALYRLDCHTWRYEGDHDFDYSGDFECRLTSLYAKDVYSTLLTDNLRQSRDWESRARILAQELVGRCADYVEYGRIRSFRLRGTRLRLEFSNVKTVKSPESATRGPWALRSFRVRVSVEPDRGARSPIAEGVKVAVPPPSCGPGYRSK